MWARVSTFQFPPDDLDRAIQQFDAAVDAFAGQPGLVRADVLVNRRTGAGITISVWESHEAMKGSEDEADRLRADIALELVGWIQAVEEYELVRSEAPGTPL
jgi:heme-degrading monooxygenase HmoA